MRLPLPLFAACAASLPAQTFQIETQVPPSQLYSGRQAMGDVTGDGHPDLVCYSWIAAYVLPGSATGVFGAALPLPQPFIASAVKLLDSNGDGVLDIWYCDHTGTARVESGAAGMSVTAFFGSAQTFACGDFDEDGDLDLMLGRPDGLVQARNDGAAGYTQLAPLGPMVMGYTRCEALDVDGDGHLDLATQSFGSAGQVWRGSGTGTFTLAAPNVFPPMYHLTAVADVDADGDPDFVAYHPTLDLMVVRNLGNCVFGPPQVQTGCPAVEAAVADFDGDGNVDLVAAGGGQLRLLLGTGGGSFAAPLVFPVAASSIVVGDLEGDGRAEAVMLQASTSLAILRDVSPAPVGLTAFGPGMPSCGGTIGISGTTVPAVGATNFRVTCTNVPPGSYGIVGIGDAVAGYVDPQLGLRVHLGAAAPLATMWADAGGTASFALPIPGAAQLAGLQATLQSFWLPPPSLGSTCSPAAFDLASSRGLTLTIQ